MKNRGLRVVDRGRQRALDHRGTRADKSPIVAVGHTYKSGTICDGCGSVYSLKTWRRSGERPAAATAPGAARGRCPACLQVGEGRAYGRVVLRGPWLKGHEDEVRHRIANVEARARHTQPERRVIEIAQRKDGLEVMSTSQKLAHRLVREIEKAFGGRSSYRWSDTDGSLTATWAHD
jgi:NMD protein affecting ribosome stability and mRNA decay